MTVHLFLTALALCAAPAATAGGEDDPRPGTNVGDYATYKLTLTAGGTNLGGHCTKTVTATRDKQATVRMTGSVESDGRKTDFPEQTLTIDLTRPHDPTNAAAGLPGGLPSGAGVTVEKGKEGKEKVKVSGREYDTTRTAYKINAKAGGQDVAGEMTVWTSKEVPLGLVRVEMIVDAYKLKMTMELTGSGSGKK
jgi:hypothetical protein